MKFIAASCLMMVLNACAEPEKETVVPLIGSRFGEIVRIEAEFIPKANTYHDQNIVKEPFLISVLVVNGQSLKKPIVMEYRSSGKVPEFKNDKRYQLEAYETIYVEGAVRGWDDEIAQVDYQICHVIVIRPTKPRGEPIVGGDRVNPPPQR